jgi:hypothetical protein
LEIRSVFVFTEELLNQQSATASAKRVEKEEDFLVRSGRLGQGLVERTLVPLDSLAEHGRGQEEKNRKP